MLVEMWNKPLVLTILTVVRELAPESYVVGGTVRDALVGRPSRMDIDLAVRADGFSVARSLAELLRPRKATFVPLDADRGTGRVVLGEPEAATVDLSSFKGPTIIEDLYARDFTINAMAVKVEEILHGGPINVIDPTGGRADAQAHRLKACSSRAFTDDPLRVLRAYRFQAMLDFEITPQTAHLIRSGLPGLGIVAPERIRDEFMSTLAADNSWRSLREMDRDGPLDALFPELSCMKGVEQNAYHHLDVWDHTLETVRRLETIPTDRAERFGDLASVIDEYCRQEPVQGRPRTALLKLAALFHDSGKPAGMTRDSDGRVRFIGHEKISADLFEHAGGRLKLARREIRLVRGWIRGHMRPMIPTGDDVSRRAGRRLHRAFGNDLIGLLLLFLADLAASRGIARSPETDDRAVEQVRRLMALSLESERTTRPPLLTGREIIGIFGLTPGPLIGGILRRLEELQESGEIETRNQAVAAAKVYLSGLNEGSSGNRQ